MFRKAITWVAAMTWHLFRIATLRPAFDKLSDTSSVTRSFFAVFFGAELLRWIVLYPAQYPEVVALMVVFKVLIEGFFILLVFGSIRHNSSLSASVLGVCALIDLTVSTLYMLGAISSVKVAGWPETIVQLFWVAAMVYQFSRAPAAARECGYRGPHAAA